MNLESLGSSALNIVVIVVLIFITIACVVGIVLLIFKKKKYSEFKCVVWEKGLNGGVIESVDRAGIFVNRKTRNKRFWLQKANVGLSPDHIPYIQSRKEKIVYLLRVGLKNFYFIEPEIDPVIKFSVGEEDVNWSVNAYEAQKKRFSSSLLMQILPFAGLIFVCIIILILFIYLFKKFDSLKEMISMMVEISKSLAQAKTGIIS